MPEVRGDVPEAGARPGPQAPAAASPGTPPNGVLARMLERLFAAITSGPSLNCRPHASRQRLDLTQLSKLGDIAPGQALASLLGEGGEAKLTARVPPAKTVRPGDPQPRASDEPTAQAPADASDGPVREPAEDPDAKARKAWADQQSVLSKLRVIAEEARTYEDDTGVSVLALGFPLLSVPAGAAGGGRRGSTRRVLAPIAFIPVTVTTRTGVSPSIDIACRNDNVDRVSANEGLMAWLEQQTGEKEPELFTDEEGSDPWREVRELVAFVARVMKIEIPAPFDSPIMPESLPLVAAPRAEEDGERPAIIPGAVLGLFPVTNQGLLRDTQAMLAGESHAGPLQGFLRADAALTAAPSAEPGVRAPDRAKRGKVFSEERLISPADPCQARAVALARMSPALVVHGPPGTGKSQTITNIIGDHLSRGERVLFVCDKRTALDVVYNRLEHMGLGGLCALVHDPQRDQRELYMAVRDQLEALAEARTHPRAQDSLKKADEELQQIHAELTRHHARLAGSPSAGAPSFHDLVGRWLAIPDSQTLTLPATPAPAPALAALEAAGLEIRGILARAQEVAYPANPWRSAAGLGLDSFLSRSMDTIRETLRTLADAAGAADAAIDPEIPPFSPDGSVEEQATARAQLAPKLEVALAQPAPVRAHWARQEVGAITTARRAIADAAPSLKRIREAALDGELAMVIRDRSPDAAEVARQLGALESYLATAGAWYGALFFGRRSAAAKILAAYGLSLSPETAARLRDFLTTLRALLVARSLLETLQKDASGTGLPAAADLDRVITSHQRLLEVLGGIHESASLRPLWPLVTAAISPSGDGAVSPAAPALVRGLKRSPDRARPLARLEAAFAAAGLFNADWLEAGRRSGRAGEAAGPVVAALRAEVPTLESVLRIREGLARLAPDLRGPVEALVSACASPEQGLATLERSALAAEIGRRLASDPDLRATDARRLESLFTRVRELEALKQRLTRDAVLHSWVSRQKERLLVGTGSRLNSAGAEVRRRLTVRGRRAMRLRQVLSLGRGAEGGDPIMDLRPVWMASPETVAQIFPREPIFDAVIFDEASQCRLEEALPVLTRARRVVIAGDPKQLPPTRFFETAIAASETDEIETDQQLFEAQQGEVEDLLGAALNLDIQSCYLDVHYRSRNADLIAFSNAQFYASRLQPIPAHPSHRAPAAPITLYRAGGTYDKRVNPAEADRVCQIVRELLNDPKPPSIGIGCFNLAQRDLIAERLDTLASGDPAFARRLAAARERRGEASFEGLFVKNLENVQGDERDHIIISTTYGPDPGGRFYRRFGPLAMPGGGRRLNVLVTRARQRVHVVTSIPPDVYASLPPVPPGQTAGGGWLLFAYLAFAEQVERAYEAPSPVIPDAASPAALDREVEVRATRWPSQFAESLAASFAAGSGVASEVYWGNDGFCVDVALRHPARPDDVTVGILCDGSRYALADDPVEWDIFRTGILESQGWTLRRVWSPVFFRDVRGTTDTILSQASALAAPERKGGTRPASA